jgi:hypothetical protein
MFVRCVRATVVVLAIAWVGSAIAQEAVPSDGPADPIGDAIRGTAGNGIGDDTYIADPSESFIVEHSGQVAAAAQRPTSSRNERCRAYTSDDDSAYPEGLACPQPDGSWRIVGGPQDPSRARQNEERAIAPSREYPDYTDDEGDGREALRPARRFRLDWDAWSSGRRGNSTRFNGYRNE